MKATVPRLERAVVMPDCQGPGSGIQMQPPKLQTQSAEELRFLSSSPDLAAGIPWPCIQHPAIPSPLLGYSLCQVFTRDMCSGVRPLTGPFNHRLTACASSAPTLPLERPSCSLLGASIIAQQIKE